MSTYEKLLFMHFVFVALLVGGEGVATATGIGMSRTSDTRTIEMLARLSSKAEYLALIPGALGTIVTGTWLVDELAYLEFEQGWLTASYVIWAVATWNPEVVEKVGNVWARARSCTRRRASG